MRLDTIFCILSATSLLTAVPAWAAPSERDIEAETGALGTPEVAVVQNLEGASGGAAVQIGVQTNAKEQPAGTADPELLLTVPLPWRGHTVVWGRVLARNGGSDSLWVSLDGGPYRMLSPQASPEWRWHRFGQLRTREPGDFTVRIRHRETGLLLDKVVLTTRVAARPEGFGELTHQPVDSPFPDPPVTPPNEHPRVFLRQSFLPTLRERLTHPLLAPAVEQLHRSAHQPGDGVLPPPRDPEGSNYSRQVLRTIDANALLYLLDGDVDKGHRALRMVAAFNNSVIYPPRHDVTRDYARTILTNALVYDWCHDLTDETWRAQQREHILRLASMMEIGYPPLGQSAITSHGGEAQLLRALLAAGIAVYDEFPEIYEVSAGRFFAEFVPARNFFFQAHWHHQGDSYGWYRFRWSLFAAYLFQRMGAGMVFTPDQAQVPYSWIYMRRPDGQLLRDGDTFSRGDYWAFPLVAMMTASLYRDPVIHAEYRRQCLVRPHIRESFWNVLFYDPTVPVTPIAELPLTRYFPEPMGIMVARTGWQMGVWSPTIVVEMKGAGYHFNNHDHLDAGSFQIYYKGALATDAGSYGHYGIPYDFAWNKRSVSHNALLIYDPEHAPDPHTHDGGQNFPNNRREPKNLEVLFEKDYRNGAVLAHAAGPDPVRPAYSHLKADLTPGYRDRAERVERSFVFLNLDREVPAAMVILDRVRVKEPALRPVWLLHSVEEPALSADTIDVRRTAGGCNGRLVVKTLVPKRPAYRVIGGPGRESEVFGHNFEADRPTEESQGWRVQITGGGETGPVSFLHVLQVMDDRDGPEPLACGTIAGDDLLGVTVGSTLVGFSADGGAVTSTCGIALPDTGPWDVVLTDLAPGAWEVMHNGTSLGIARIKAENGTASLQTTGGRLVLRPLQGKDGADPLRAIATPALPESESGLALVVSGKRIDSPPGIRRGDTGIWVPLAPAAKALGYNVKRADDELILSRGDDVCRVRVGEAFARFNAVTTPLTQPVPEMDGALWADHEDLRAILHVRTEFDPVSQAVMLSPVPDDQVWVASVSASAHESGREPEVSFDGDLRTYWAAEGDGQWIQYDLGRSRAVTAIDVAWLHGDERQQRFEVQLSNDGTTWSTVFSGSSSGTADRFETVAFPLRTTRFVRIVGHENTKNRWNSIREVVIRPARTSRQHD